MPKAAGGTSALMSRFVEPGARPSSPYKPVLEQHRALWLGDVRKLESLDPFLHSDR